MTRAGTGFASTRSSPKPTARRRCRLPYYIPQRVTPIAATDGYDASTSATFYWTEDACTTAATGAGETCVQATNVDVTVVALSDYPWVVPNWNGAQFDANGPTFININMDGPSGQGLVTEAPGSVPVNFRPPNNDASVTGAWFRISYVLHGTWIKFELDFSQLAFYDFDSNVGSAQEMLCMANGDAPRSNELRSTSRQILGQPMPGKHQCSGLRHRRGPERYSGATSLASALTIRITPQVLDAA